MSGVWLQIHNALPDGELDQLRIGLEPVILRSDRYGRHSQFSVVAGPRYPLYRNFPLVDRFGTIAVRDADHIGDLAYELYLQALVNWVHDNVVDEAPKNGDRLVPILRIVERGSQGRHFAPVEFCEIGMKYRAGRLGSFDFRFELAFLRLQFV